MASELLLCQASTLVVDSLTDCATNLRVDRGLGDVDPHEVPSLPHRVEVTDTNLLALLFERIVIGQSAHEVLDHLCGAALQDGEEKASFAVEVAVNKAFGTVGTLRYLARRRAVIASHGEY